ncbi:MULTISPECIES: FxSxx-COOH system tetratricopeptide repeat protein [unclassified Streptomyces]|uniref:FxSxx-COOH system tetratricopeptide repeat protein n=1 Tax=unclassified Streptomyces TaxID=2593676 RepID=UPI002E806AA4|nr:FxSxx-COOH system tetratricopeptide repeat protein [Streptomyces sp. NBC_00589]WTI40453.1 FxSxx-COOH system tetratricopeptide repeat protein [Streptomyces sp. NBC_00775]WUB25863.1 FxSxx-COOH system tetratricopeptide repeat protein [Streptomyces sp. NBC_00589]
MPDANPLDRAGSFTIFFTTSENLGLSTTLRNAADILAEGNRSVLLVDGRSGDPADGLPVPDPVAGLVSTARLTTPAALTALAGDPVAARYDHVLVEAPVPDAPDAVEPARLVGFADAIVICFALTAWSIDGAAALAEDLSGTQADRPVRVLTLGLKSDVGVHDRLRDARERVRRKFGPLAQARDEREFPFLEIPYNPLYLDSRSLAVETEGVGTVTGLRPYYERLADWLRVSRPARFTHVTVVHSARHALWAAWLQDRLGERGVRTVLRRDDTYAGERPAAGAALLFLSPGDADDTLLAQIGALSHTDVRIVLVDEPFPHTAAAHHERIDLRDTTEDEALRLLCTTLGLDPAGPREGARGARFPRLPETTNVAPRNGDFIDRDALLATLDEQLRGAGREGGCLVLHGPSGWGKSETARELCHRYGARYDVVWWVRAWETLRVQRGLARLAGRLGTAEDQLGVVAPDGGVSRLLTRLSRPDSDSGNWLIVYDGVVDPAELHGLLPVPHERGHVLITSRVAPPERQPDARPPHMTATAIGPMRPAECRALLCERLPEITEDQAQQVGSVVDSVPLALHLAAHCLAERADAHRRDDHMGPDAAARAAVADLLAEYRTCKTELLGETGSVPPVAVMVRVAQNVAGATPGAAAWRAESPAHDALGWLLGAASLLTGRGTGLELLRSRRILSELARDDSAEPEAAEGTLRHRHPDDVQLPDEHMVSVALWALAQVGLLDVDFDRKEQPLVQHHALRDLIRDGMDPAKREHVESVLRSVLAEYVPQEDQDLPADWAREVYSLRLWEDSRPRVRRSMLRHLNALSQRGESADLARLLDISGKAREAWQADGDEQTPEYLRLLNLTARAHRLGGDNECSRELSQEALRGHRRLLGLTHPRTLLSADSHAATLRALGRFEDALIQIRPAMEGLTLLLGSKHPATVQVEHNLALTEALTGRVSVALGRLQARFRYRQAVGGKEDPIAWRSADLLAYLYRMSGRDGEARDLLRQRLRRYGDTWDGGRLKTEVGLAVSERRLADGFPAVKDPRYGFEMAHERDLRALKLYVSRFGADRFDTLRCQFSYAADLHALGKVEEAEQQARQCGDALAARFGVGHPYTGLSQVRHAVYLRSMGEVQRAEDEGRAAVHLLSHKVGQSHPWVAVAENSLAATLAAADRTDEAAQLARSALNRLRDLGVAHRPDGRRVRAHHARLTGSDTSRPVPPSGFDIDLELPGL